SLSCAIVTPLLFITISTRSLTSTLFPYTTLFRSVFTDRVPLQRRFEENGGFLLGEDAPGIAQRFGEPMHSRSSGTRQDRASEPVHPCLCIDHSRIGVQQGVLRGQGDDGGELDAGVAHRLVEVRGLSVDADTDAFEPGPSDPDRGTAGCDR